MSDGRSKAGNVGESQKGDVRVSQGAPVRVNLKTFAVKIEAGALFIRLD
jgi:hypothetical protein